MGTSCFSTGQAEHRTPINIEVDRPSVVCIAPKSVSDSVSNSNFGASQVSLTQITQSVTSGWTPAKRARDTFDAICDSDLGSNLPLPLCREITEMSLFPDAPEIGDQIQRVAEPALGQRDWSDEVPTDIF